VNIQVKTPLRIPTVLPAATAASSQANPRFFPRPRPLFVGLDEAKVPARAKNALQEAKIDFQRARLAERPRFAVYTAESSEPRDKVYQGQGYQITEVHHWRQAHQYGEVNREGQW
jgi:hypothetical protein